MYGKVGLFENDAVKYTFVVVRKRHLGKVIYRREKDSPYVGVNSLSGGGKMSIDEKPQEYDFYDYWVVFNGKKFGPYDRIHEMHLEDGNVDNWVSADGKSITFAGVKGQMYYPVIANRTYTPFWSVDQAPDCSPVSGKTGFIIQWGQNDFRLLVDGSIKLTGWKSLKGLEYSKNGDIAYQGTEPNSNDNYVYLNYRKFAGPYGSVRQATFIPNTNILCALGYGSDVIIGDKKIPIPAGQSAGDLTIAGDWVSFYVSQSSTYSFYEYNYKTGQLLEHEGFAKRASIYNIDKNTIYYTTYNAKGDQLLVKQGGTILQTIPKSSHKDNSVRFKVSPNGDYISWYTNGYSKPYTLMLNGKPFTAAGNKIMGVEEASFCPVKHTLRLIVNTDKSTGSMSRKYIIGNNTFDLDGKFSEEFPGFRVFPTQSDDIFHVQGFASSRPYMNYEIYKNDKRLTDVKWSSVSELTASPNGNSYAALVTDLQNISLYYYFCLNRDMNYKRKLLVDGNIVSGNFGAPVWSKQKGKFLVLQEKNQRVTLTEQIGRAHV